VKNWVIWIVIWNKEELIINYKIELDSILNTCMRKKKKGKYIFIYAKYANMEISDLPNFS